MKSFQHHGFQSQPADAGAKFIRNKSISTARFCQNNIKINRKGYPFAIYFQFAYTFLRCPFRLKRDKNGNLELHTWFPQQVLCGISNILGVLKTITTLRTTIRRMKLGHDGPLAYLDFFSRTAALSYHLLACKAFWCKSQAFLKLAKFLDENPNLVTPDNLKWVASPGLVFVLCSIYTGFTIHLGTINYLHSYNWSLTLWFANLLPQAHSMFFFEGKSPSYVANFPNFALAAVELVCQQSQLFIRYFSDLCQLMCTISLFLPLISFSNELYNEVINVLPREGKHVRRSKAVTIERDLEHLIKQDVDQKMARFLALRTLSELIENAVGDMILPFLVETMFYFARMFHVLFITEDLLTKFRLGFNFCSASIIIILSAEIVRKIRWFRQWLGEEKRLHVIDENIFSALLHDLKLNKVGMTAAGMFVVDYSLLGTMTSLCITFLVVRLQSTEK